MTTDEEQRCRNLANDIQIDPDEFVAYCRARDEEAKCREDTTETYYR